MPIPATNIKTISKIDSFRFINFPFLRVFVPLLLYYILLFIAICVSAVPVREDSLCNTKTYSARAKGLVKCKIENGKWKINVGKTVCNVKNILCPTVKM